MDARRDQVVTRGGAGGNSQSFLCAGVETQLWSKSFLVFL